MFWHTLKPNTVYCLLNLRENFQIGADKKLAQILSYTIGNNYMKKIKNDLILPKQDCIERLACYLKAFNNEYVSSTIPQKTLWEINQYF